MVPRLAWRYVDSKQNPSDASSRVLSAKTLLENDFCISGPDFLWQDESSLLAPPAGRENISYDVLEFKREMLVHAVELDKSMKNVEKLLCHVFLFFGQAWKASGVHIAFQGMVAEQGGLEVRPNQGSVLANEGESYCC